MKTLQIFLFCCLCSFSATAQNSRVFLDAGMHLHQPENDDLGPAFGIGYRYHLKLGATLGLVGGIETHYGSFTQKTVDRRNVNTIPDRTSHFKQFSTVPRIQSAIVLGLAYQLGKWEIQLSALPTYIVHSRVSQTNLHQRHQLHDPVPQERILIPRGEWFGDTEEFEGSRLWYSSRLTLNGEISLSHTIGKRLSVGLAYNQTLTYQQLQFDPSSCFEVLENCSTTEPQKFLDPRLRRFAARIAYSF